MICVVGECLTSCGVVVVECCRAYVVVVVSDVVGKINGYACELQLEDKFECSKSECAVLSKLKNL